MSRVASAYAGLEGLWVPVVELYRGGAFDVRLHLVGVSLEAAGVILVLT